MAESLFASLLHTLDRGNISQIAGSLKESDHSVARGLEASVASVLGVMASKADDPGGLRRMLDLVPDNAGEVSWSTLATGLSTPGSLVAKGKQMLSSLFGSNSTAIANAVGAESGVSANTATTLLMMAVPMVMRFLTRKVRDEGLSMGGLGTLLQREAGTIRSALPAGVSELFWPRATTSPVIAQSVQPERSSSAGWLGALGLAGLLALGGIWLWNHNRRPVMLTGTANRLAEDSSQLGDFVKRRLPNNVDLNVPAYGVESQLLGIIKGTSPVGTTWIDFDRLTFDSGSSTLRPESGEQVDNIAAILKAYPNVRLTLAGYTDTVGSAESNLALSQARAETVKNQLVARGITPERLEAKGFGEQGSADNSTATGRAQNRRVSLQVTQR